MRRKRLDWFAWEPAAYRAKTAHLSRDADLAYRRILEEIFLKAQDDPRLPDDDVYLCGVGRCDPENWKRVRRELIDGPQPLLRKRGRYIYSDRMTEEIQIAQVKSSQATDAAEQRWNSERNANAMQAQSVGNATKRESKKEKELPSPNGEGTRAREKKVPVPDPFLVDADLREWARSDAPLVDTLSETANLVEFFRDIKPQKRTPVGWQATWRTWMRKAQKDAAARPSGPRRLSKETASQVGAGHPTTAAPPATRAAAEYVDAHGRRTALEHINPAELPAWDAGFTAAVGITPDQYRRAHTRYQQTGQWEIAPKEVDA